MAHLERMQCDQHPEAQAFHECSRCGVWHCEACAKRVHAGKVKSAPILVCPRCDGVLRETAKPVLAGKEEASDLLRRPLSGEGALTAVMLAVPYWFSSAPAGLGLACSFVYFSCLAGFYFQTVDHIGRGKEGLPFSPSEITKSDLLRSLFRGFLCAAVALGPALFWFNVARGGLPVGLLLLVFGALCAPAAILAIVVTGRSLNALWPGAWVQIAMRSPETYVKLAGVFLLSSVIWVASLALVVFTLGRLPFLGNLITGAVNASFALAQAALVGGYLRRNAESFGYD